jgi:hypothetical protein
VAQTTPQRDLTDPATRAALAANARARYATAMVREVGQSPIATFASRGDVASAGSRAPLSAAMDVGRSSVADDNVLEDGAVDGAAAGDARRASSVSIAGTPGLESEAWGEPEAEADSSDELFGEDTADGVWRATYPAPPRAPPAPAPRGSSVDFGGLFDESAEYESDE